GGASPDPRARPGAGARRPAVGVMPGGLVVDSTWETPRRPDQPHAADEVKTSVTRSRSAPRRRRPGTRPHRKGPRSPDRWAGQPPSLTGRHPAPLITPQPVRSMEAGAMI